MAQAGQTAASGVLDVVVAPCMCMFTTYVTGGTFECLNNDERDVMSCFGRVYAADDPRALESPSDWAPHYVRLFQNVLAWEEDVIEHPALANVMKVAKKFAERDDIPFENMAEFFKMCRNN